MKNFSITLIIFFCFSFSSSGSERYSSLMPVPYSLKEQPGEFRVTAAFCVAVNNNTGDRVFNNAGRMLKRLSGRTGLFFRQDYVTPAFSPDSAACVLQCDRKGVLKAIEEESYTLTISPEKILLTAETDFGIIRGLETLLQLLQSDKNGYYFPAVEIFDRPRFPWRGLLIDVGRHFQPVDVIKRNLDGLAAVKMNVFHWHLTEDQGFRVESKIFPKLHLLGSDGMFYTQEQIKDIVAYAEDRGIRVIPEFDLPGHSTSWFVAYPELASAPGTYSIERNWGVFDPTFNPIIEKTYDLLDGFLGEMASLFPDEYLHIGGDENNGKQWKSNTEIQTFMKENGIADNHALQGYFNKRLLNILTKYGKKMIGWDEILHPDMPKNIVIQSWRGSKGLFDAARKGYRAILSNGYYIDLMQPAEFHYLNDPIPADSIISDDERKLILGGEGTMWGELVTCETIDSRIWPRTAAIAERLWSRADVRDVDDMYRRMEIISFRLEELGITHIKNYEMMLRRLTNNGDAAALMTLADAVEPVKIYARHFQGKKYTSYSPYTRLVDAARPESYTARTFKKNVKKWILNKNPDDAANIISLLKKWKNNHELIYLLMDQSPVLREIDTLSQNLSAAASVGIEAIEKINSNVKGSERWYAESMACIEKAKKPYGQTEIMILPGIASLIDAAAKRK